MNKAMDYQRECAALEAMAARGFDGRAAPGYAFGSARLALMLDGDVFRDFYLSIRRTGRGLALEVDSYTAKVGRWAQLHQDFDADAWEAGLIKVCQPRADRQAFRSLHRTARVLLAGFKLRTGTSEVARKRIRHAKNRTV